MKIFNFLKNLLPQPGSGSNVFYIYYQCNKCKQAFPLLLRKSYDIQTVYEDVKDYTYLYHKELRDPKCFNDIHISIYFDQAYRVVKEEIKGGKLLTKEEYEKLVGDR